MDYMDRLHLKIKSSRAEELENRALPLDQDARAMLAQMADGDGRAALTLAEEVWRAAKPDELFVDTVKRLGVEPFKERVYATR